MANSHPSHLRALSSASSAVKNQPLSIGENEETLWIAILKTCRQN
jgi:hypothetical protein